MILCLGFLLSLSPVGAHPWESRDWLNILHMKHGSLERRGAWLSEVVDPAFFSSPQGFNNPKAEWDEVVRQMASPYTGDPDRRIDCLFPARTRVVQLFYQHQGNRIQPTCPALETWKRKLHARSATIVLAAQYAADPGSLFGHIFLRFDVYSSNQTPSQLQLETLASSVGFFAIMPPDVSSLDYVTKGLMGGFMGSFVMSNYAQALNNYSDMENRELQEYELNLNPEELDRLLNHLWEMLHFGRIPYAFFRKNCAYQLLTLLEAAINRLDLSSTFYFYVIPSDVIRKLSDVGLVRKMRVRPSLGVRVRQKIGQLTAKQRSNVMGAVDFLQAYSL